MSGWLVDDTGRHTFEVVQIGGGTPVAYSTSVKKFGSSSAKFVRTSDTIASVLKTANHADFNIGGTWSINFWIYPQYQAGELHGVMSNWDSSGTDTGWNVNFDANADEVRMQASSGLDTGSSLSTAGTAYPCTANQWSHVAISRESDANPPAERRWWRIFVNGVLAYSYGNAGQHAYGPRSTSAPFYIGSRNDSLDDFPIEFFNGYIDALHIEVGVNNWTGLSVGQTYFDHNALTAPTATAYSVLLMNFNETLFEVAGTLNQQSQIYIIDEATNTIEYEGVKSAGAYSEQVSDGNAKTVIAVRESNGETLAYGRVIPNQL